MSEVLYTSKKNVKDNQDSLLELESKGDSIDIDAITGQKSCSVCGKSQTSLQIDKIPLVDKNGTFICSECIKKSKIQALSLPVAQDGQDHVIIEENKNKDLKAHPPFHKSQISENIKNELDQLLKGMNKDLLEEIKNTETSMASFLTKNEMSLIKTNLEFPPMCQRILTTFKLVRASIIVSHPVTDLFNIDLNKNPGAAQNSIIAPFLSLFPYKFDLSRCELLEYLINIAIMMSELLRDKMIEARMFDRRAERWWGFISKQLEDLQMRTMSFDNSFVTQSGRFYEMQKIFSGVYSCLSRLAAIESKLTKDDYSAIKTQWANVHHDKQREFIISNFDTKYFNLMDLNTKIEILSLLMADSELHDNFDPHWEKLLTIIGKLTEKNRGKFLQSLRQKLMPDEIDLIVPELAKLRGKINPI